MENINSDDLKKSILIFEDDFDLVWQWKRFLKENNYKVDVSTNIDEVIELCKNNVYDIIICDLFIKGLDGKIKHQGGTTMVTYLRSKTLNKFPKWTQEVPILLVSGTQKINGFDPLFITGTLGATKTLRKPFSKEQLLNNVVELLEHQK